jgi:hypothetical protein
MCGKMKSAPKFSYGTLSGSGYAEAGNNRPHARPADRNGMRRALNARTQVGSESA